MTNTSTSQLNHPNQSNNHIDLKGYRLMTKKDTSLIEAEIQKLKSVGYNLCCCLCCDDTEAISKIINRRVYSCWTCYCCIGDDPYGDLCKVYVNDEDGSIYTTTTEEEQEELERFNEEYDRKMKRRRFSRF
jgi:hypothetical protein